MSDLRTFLEENFAARGGTMPFEDFMALALYDAERGYYTKGIADVGGTRGDFSTAATLSDALARAISKWIVGEIAAHRWTGPVHVIEVGGGNGALATGILKALGWWRRRSIRYHLVEVSPVLRELQRKRLGASIAWHGKVADALTACGGRALIFSNELVDAFPAKWLRWEGTRWEEIHVAYDPARGMGEVFHPLTDDISPEHFSALALTEPLIGQRIEILPSFRDWLKGVASLWHEGSMLTIDYGADSADAIYARRTDGTLRAYHRQQRIEGGGIYARFGKQDLTSDVNFADLAKWGEELGWETIRLGSQRDFLTRHDTGDGAMTGEGPGDAFRVLEQRLRN